MTIVMVVIVKHVTCNLKTSHNAVYNVLDNNRASQYLLEALEAPQGRFAVQRRGRHNLLVGAHVIDGTQVMKTFAAASR
jgi:hypothetical protein